MNKNHAIQTRRKAIGHYQVVLVNVQSGKCLKVLCDAVKDAEMSPTEFEVYVEGMYQTFLRMSQSADVVDSIFRNEWY